VDTGTNSSTIQLPDQGLQPMSSAPNMKADESDVLGRFYTSNRPTFHLFPYKTLFLPWCSSTIKPQRGNY